MKIAFIGFGEAARAFCHSLRESDPALRFSAWDRLLEQPGQAPAMRAAMAQAGVAEASGPAGLAEADWIISAVTADQSLIAVQALVPHLRRGHLVIDVNSVSPQRKRESAAAVEARGAAYLDMAVMAPVHPRGHRTPVLVAGAAAQGTMETLTALGFAAEFAGAQTGAATAIKMVRSLFVKGLEAITVEALLAARASGCFDAVLGSLSRSFPGLGWPDFAAYQFERTLTHGRRRAAEMQESAATLDALGLNGGLAREIARVEALMAAPGTAAPSTDNPEAAIDAILARRLARAEENHEED